MSSNNSLPNSNLREIATESKQSDDILITLEENSSSESLEISYTKQSSRYSIRSNTNNNHMINIENEIFINDDDEEEDDSSSHYEEDEDSKMMELPELPIRLSSISSLSPRLNKQIRYSPMKKYKKYNKDYDQFQIVNTMHECTQNIISYQNSQSILTRINCTQQHNYWKRFGLCFSLGLLVCSIIALLLTLYDDNFWKYSSILVLLFPLIVFGLVLFRLCLKYNLLNDRISSTTPSIELSAYYKDIQIRNDVMDTLNKDKCFTFDLNKHMVYASDIGYSGIAALNTILSSIYDNSLFFTFPRKPTNNMSLEDIMKLIQFKIMEDNNIDILQFPKIKLNVQMIDNQQINLAKFQTLIQEMDRKSEHGQYIRTYFIAQFNKQPLFFCGGGGIYGYLQGMMKWVSNHGYFSPIIGYHMDEEENIYVSMLDVNQDYGNYLVPISRMYQAIKYCDQNGKSGGLLKIDAHLIS